MTPFRRREFSSKTLPKLTLSRERLLREFSARDVPFFVVHDFKGSAEDLRRLLATSPRLFVGLSGQLFRDHVLLSDLHALPLSRMRECPLVPPT